MSKLIKTSRVFTVSMASVISVTLVAAVSPPPQNLGEETYSAFASITHGMANAIKSEFGMRNVNRTRHSAATASFKIANLKSPLLESLKRQSGATFAISTPLPGVVYKWEPAAKVYAGIENLASGNFLAVHSITNWASRGIPVNIALYYNSQGAGSTIVGQKWSISYDDRISGTNNATVTEFSGRNLLFTQSNGNYASPPGQNQQLKHNSDGTWTRTWKFGLTEQFNTAGQSVSLSDSNGNTLATSRNPQGQITSITDSVGRTLNLTYNSGLVSTITDPVGTKWSLVYNANNQLVSVTDPALSGTIYSTKFSYDANNNLLTITNRLGQVYSYAYGANSALTSVTDPGNNVAGLIASSPAIADTNGFTSTSAPQTAKPDTNSVSYPTNTKSVVYWQDASGVAQEFGVDSNGLTTAYRDGTGAQSNYTNDSNNDRTSSTDPSGATTSSTFDRLGNCLTTTDPLGHAVTKTYDSANNLLTVKDANNFTTTYAYDSKRNLTSIVDKNGQTWTCGLDGYGQMVSYTEPKGGAIKYAYDANGNMTGLTDEANNTHTLGYTFDLLTSRTDPLGRTTSYTYDAWKRKTNVNYPQSVSQTISYDAEGDVTATTDGTGNRTYTYDSLQHRVATTDPRGNTSAVYDASGKVLNQTDVTGRKVTYSYDSAGRQNNVSDPSGSSQGTVFDSDGRVNAINLSGGYKITMGYDSASRKISQVTTVTGQSNPVMSGTLQYDNANRLLKDSELDAITTFSYDAKGHLLTENRTGATNYNDSYSYDSNGNRLTDNRVTNGTQITSGTYSYSSANELTAITDPVGGNQAFTWNTDGTMATMSDSNPFVKSFSYDEEKRLIGINHVQNGNSTTAYQYGYGWDGARRWRKDSLDRSYYWFPCGASCSAGEMVILSSSDSGTTWSTAQTNVGGLVQNGQELIPNGDSRSTIKESISGEAGSNTRDYFGMVRTGSENVGGFDNTIDDGFIVKQGAAYNPKIGFGSLQPYASKDYCDAQRDHNQTLCDESNSTCHDICNTGSAICIALCFLLSGLALFFCLAACAGLAGTCYKTCGDLYAACVRDVWSIWHTCMGKGKFYPVQNYPPSLL